MPKVTQLISKNSYLIAEFCWNLKPLLFLLHPATCVSMLLFYVLCPHLRLIDQFFALFVPNLSASVTWKT